jgi:hypothetical protein
VSLLQIHFFIGESKGALNIFTVSQQLDSSNYALEARRRRECSQFPAS